MANNTLNTRILICNDSEINWGTSTKVLLKGELGILFPTDTNKNPIMKVGNGVDTWNNLKTVNGVNAELQSIINSIGDLTQLSTTDKTNLVSAINEIYENYTISIDTSSTTSGYAKSYALKQGSTTIGVIDIPKDMVITSGQVVTYEDGDMLPTGVTEAGTYIELTIANATNDKIYVNAGKLVDIYTVKPNASQIQLAIDASTREISATIVDGSVGTVAIADNAITTAKIEDKSVTKDKLEQSLQNSIDKADKAVSDVNVNGNVLTKDADNVVNITEITTDILINGANTLIFDGGNSIW